MAVVTAMAETEHVTADELVVLFTGLEHEDGGWITTPCYTVPLAAAIARELQPTSEVALRKALYGERACDLIEQKALYILQLGFQRYRQQRDVQLAGRGL